MSTYIPSGKPIVDPRTGAVDIEWLKFFDTIDAAITSVAWGSLDFTGSSLTDIVTRSAAALTSGTLPLARLAGITNTEISAAAAIVRSKLSFGASDLGWTVIDKTGSSLADLATRSATDLTSGTLAQARKWSQVTTTSTGNQDDVSFSSADCLRANNASAVTFRGFAAGVGGQRLRILVVNAQVDLADQNAGSTAANRIITGTAGTITPVRFADLDYDATTLRWRVAGYA